MHFTQPRVKLPHRVKWHHGSPHPYVKVRVKIGVVRGVVGVKDGGTITLKFFTSENVCDAYVATG